MTNKLNCCAHNINKPQYKPRTVNGSYVCGAVKVLDANRKGIALLRKRHFNWYQIHKCLVKIGIDVDYVDVLNWKNSRYKHQ